MSFQPIDIKNWNRKEHFENYMNESKCTYNITANLNVTDLMDQLKAKEIKFYPAFIYMISRTVHSLPEFRTTFNAQGELGIYEEVTPNYTVFHKADRTFSAMWTSYSRDFAIFYKNYQADQETFGEEKGFWTKPGTPENTFSISMIPWVSFTSFDLNLSDDDYLLPIITGGKYFSDHNHTFLPVSLRAHHAVCDGYHVGLFFKELQELADHCEEWL